MKRVLSILMIGLGILLSGCSPSIVEQGQVGIKINLLGDDKGVQPAVSGPGRYWLTWNERMYKFPTFTQNYVWTKNPAESSPNDESIDFQTIQGLAVNADVGISYNIPRDDAPKVFQKYRRGVAEITDTFLRNHVRDALVELGSKLRIEDVYGAGKAELMNNVEKRVRAEVKPFGINVEKIYWIGNLRLPATVVEAINAKIQATQKAAQRQNEVAQARAEADKVIEAARGEADSLKLTAQAQADANRLVNASLTANLIEWEKAKRWDGKNPTTLVSNGSAGVLLGIK